MFDKKNIPETLHYRVKKILGMTSSESENEYDSFLNSLAIEAKVYISTKLDNGAVLKIEQEKLAVDLYVQYSMFSKTENENVARDKIITLDGLLDSINSKYRESKKEIKKVRGMVIF